MHLCGSAADAEDAEHSSLAYVHHSKYKLGLLRKKGAVLVLVWSFFGLYVFQRLLNTDDLGSNIPLFQKSPYVSVWFITATSIAVYPLFGWLADSCIGRYKVIKYSLYGMWIISSLLCLTFATIRGLKEADILHDPGISLDVIEIVFLIILTISLSGFLGNAIQFGIDQLVDSPSHDIALFIQLYGWGWFLTRFLSELSSNCFCEHYKEIEKLIIPLLMTVSLSLDFLCSEWLLHEPVSKNSLSLVYQVLRYAKANKYPSKRNSFSLWDRKKYSRIDLAKTTFGGPFTTQQVEDVKSFWRIIFITSLGSLYGSLVIYINEAGEKLMFLFINFCPINCSKGCFYMVLIQGFGPLFLSIFIPLVEILLSTILKRCHEISIMKRALAGMLLILVSVLLYGILDVTNYYQNIHAMYNNSTCYLDFDTCKEDRKSSLSYAYLLLPNAMYSLGTYIVLVTGIEFLCAQAPTSMKGLLFGFLYGLIGVSFVINMGWVLPIQFASKRLSSNINISCGTMYLFVVASVLFAAVLCYFCASKYYKKRERNEDQEFFPIEYS